jgi:hypothetical protein
MTPSAISKNFAVISFASFACFCLLTPSWGSSARAEDEKAAPPQEKSAPERNATEAAKASSAQPDATPAPKPSPTPKARRAVDKRVEAPAKPAQPAQTPRPALSFTDFDLEKYHKPLPPADEGEAEGAVEAPPAATVPAVQPPPAGTVPGVQPPKAPQAKPKPRPKPVVQASTEDPLKPFKDRETAEKIRQMQIETGRERIAKLQSRLDYLNAKRSALLNPASFMVGQTQTQNPPAKPGEPPPPPTPIQGPGKVAIGGFFPPIPPPQTDEDRENDKKLKVKDLLEQVENEIKSVQEELGTARDELASVETRFAEESHSR